MYFSAPLIRFIAAPAPGKRSISAFSARPGPGMTTSSALSFSIARTTALATFSGVTMNEVFVFDAELVDRALAQARVLDGAENDCRGRDARASVVIAQHAAEGDQAVLGRCVRLRVREADPSGDRRDVDDAAVAALEHLRQQQLRELDRRDQVD